MDVFPRFPIFEPKVSIIVVIYKFIERLVFNYTLILLPNQISIEDLIWTWLVGQIVFEDVPCLNCPSYQVNFTFEDH